jgi:hypothetical protein
MRHSSIRVGRLLVVVEGSSLAGLVMVGFTRWEGRAGSRWTFAESPTTASSASGRILVADACSMTDGS